MLYTNQEIDAIHGSGTAEYLRIYTTYEGVDYIGTQTGRLQLYYPPATTTTTTTTTTVEEEEVVEEDAVITSYFEAVLDENFQLILQPVDPISNILFDNTFILDTDEGVLMPSDDSTDTDTYWEFEGAVCITPKEDITI